MLQHAVGEVVQLLLANATHVKNVPGRKTDVKDSEWICAAVTASAAEAKLCARHRAARFARTKPGSYQLGGRTITPEEPNPEDLGGRQHQIGIGGQ